MMNRFGANLNLTDAQKEQARAIFSQSREASKPLFDQIRQNRQALAAAVKAGAPDAEIDKLASNLGPLMAQQSAIRAKAFAKFYATLTQDQKDKVGDHFSRMMSMGGPRGHRSHQPAAAQ
jgi:Spy/CpxP family protein refolding chaperone